jgi:hypothetical protein
VVAAGSKTVVDSEEEEEEAEDDNVRVELLVMVPSVVGSLRVLMLWV